MKRALFPLLLLLFSAYVGMPAASAETLKDAYVTRKVRILIVPGHDSDPASGGTRFRGLTEAELNLQLAWQLYQLFEGDPRFEPVMTRNSFGYNEPFNSYFVNQREGIVAFRAEARRKTAELRSTGQIVHVPSPANNSSNEASIKLYGINKWANENGIDIAIHIHFNDYPGRVLSRAGRYSGLIVFVPERQLPNHAASLPLAASVFNALKKYLPVSNEPRHSAGLVEDQELIALGGSQSLKGDIASMLIEYGYMYESAWMNPATRLPILKEMAYRTYAGVKRYFEPQAALPFSGRPYRWESPMRRSPSARADVLALQVALAGDGLYPPAYRLRNDCPISGIFGSCTVQAVLDFQAKYGLLRTGFADSKTLLKINEVYAYSVPELAE